jgi:HPt (histidine-containing phosphotransfer) domain-containing protein
MARPVAPLLDVSALEKLRALQDEAEPELLAELAHDFLTRASQSVQQMRELLARGDIEAFELRAHSLAGNSGMFGMMRLREHCLALETLTRGGRLEGAGELLAEVERAFTEARPLLLAELGLPE